MAHPNTDEINEILASDEKLRELSSSSGLAVDAVRSVLSKLLEEPQVQKEAEDFLFSKDTSLDLKTYVAAQQVGRKAGHSEGFGKGVAVTLACVVLVAAAILQAKRG